MNEEAAVVLLVIAGAALVALAFLILEKLRGDDG